MQKQMSDPVKMQMLMQRGGFPWALAGLTMLPMLMGKGKADTIRKQMAAVHTPMMQRGGLPIGALVSKGLPLLKAIGAPLAMGALASIGDNVVDKVFGKGDGGSQDGGLPVPRRRSGRVGHVRKAGSSRSIARRSGKSMKRTSGRTMPRKPKGVSSAARVRRRTGPRKVGSRSRSRSRMGRQHTSHAKRSSWLQKGTRAVHDRLESAGRRLFEKAKDRISSGIRRGVPRQRSNNASPFARKIRENLGKALASTPSSLTSSHIGQSFNI